jgi:hypothetical protein
MTWLDGVKGDPLSWLLEDEPAGVRYLALRDLQDRPEDDRELIAARDAAYAQGPIAAVLQAMASDGSWAGSGPGYLPKYRSTVWSVVLLAQLGASVRGDARVARACQHVLDASLAAGGKFTMTGAPSGTLDCLQGNLCWALTALGCDDPRVADAFDWMARTVTGEGIASRDDLRAADRFYAGKCGPGFACGANNGKPCAWGAVKIVLALGCVPAERRTPLLEGAIRDGVEFLLGTDPAAAEYPAGYAARPSGNWWKFGFPVFYVTDILQIVEALAALGAGTDPRLAGAIDLVLGLQTTEGRWSLNYDYAGKTWVDFGPKRQPNKWVTLRALRALKAVGRAVPDG